MPRKITLLPDPDGLVGNVCYQQGLNFKGNDLWVDPHVPQIRKKDGALTTIKPELGRAMWRDVGTLLYDENMKWVRQPLVIRLLDHVIPELPPVIRIREAGLVTNQAQYVDRMEDELSLPGKLMKDEWAADLIREDLRLVEQMQHWLHKCVEDQMEKDLADQAAAAFLGKAHDEVFGRTMQEVLEDMDVAEHVTRFGERIRGLLKQTIR